MDVRVLVEDIAAFRASLLRWYRTHGRDLPWRHTRDPYAILVSEIMLQQTQVATVLPYYERWLRRFPDIHALAAARETDVLHAWQGLGYYARARSLHAAAKEVARNGWPDDLTRLPGVGRYTANAVATFAFDRAVPVVEANIARLLARVSNLQVSIDSTAGREALWRLATALVPKRNAARFNSALMDLGATICSARQPKCSACVVRRFCRAPDPLLLPMKKSRAATVELREHHAFVRTGDRILLEQSQDRWRGMWILPRLTTARGERPIYTAAFPFTHHRITLVVHRTRSAPRGSWFHAHEVASLPVPSPHRRALSHLLGASART